MIVAQTDQPFIRWDWIGRNLDNLWARTQEHIVLTVIAVGVGLILSLALSLVALRWRKAYAPITWVAGVLYSIPSLALFAFLVPITHLTVLTAGNGCIQGRVHTGRCWRRPGAWATPSAASSPTSSSPWHFR